YSLDSNYSFFNIYGGLRDLHSFPTRRSSDLLLRWKNGGFFVSDEKKKNLTPVQQEYQDFVKKREPDRPIFKNCIRAFLVGGTICLIGQFLSTFYMRFFDFTEKTAGDPTVATLVILSILLTGLGVYDHIAQWAGAGTIIPVTGF